LRAQEAFTFATDTTPANFQITGGRYGIDAMASAWGTATLNKIGQDGSTLIAAATAFSANGTKLVDLPPGLYQLTLSGTTGFKGCISRVPQD
jgi:hypothetical protein